MKSLDANNLIIMFENGANEIAKNYEYINELNVFPVPDGDTGTNMKITTANAIQNCKNQISPGISIYELGKVYCRQLLMNARGNSGVIFSQIIRGFFEPITEKDNVLTVDLLIKCFSAAKEKAYKSVVNPVEGTILTVVRKVSEFLQETNYESVVELFENALNIAWQTLKETPDLLPSLKEAKVVDSGGYGLCKFLEGIYTYLLTLTASNISEIESNQILQNANLINELTLTSKNTFIQNKVRSEINEEGFGYCCEFIIQKDFITHQNQTKKIAFDSKNFNTELLSIGDSLVVIEDFEIVKVHIHSFTPAKVLAIGQKYGEFLKIKVDNMTLQYIENHPEISKENLFTQFKLTNDIKLVATCASKKIAKYLQTEFGVTQIITTETTGNPSTNELMTKIGNCKSKNVILLIDDSNIILSADQAADFLKDKYKISVIKSKNIIEVIAACLVFNANTTVEENTRKMYRTLKKIDTALLSTSVKTAKFNGIYVEKNDYIGIFDKKVVLSEKTSEIGAINLLRRLRDRNKKGSVFYIVYGFGVTLREIRNLEKYANEHFGIKCKLINGGQKVYKYYIGLL